MSAARSFKAFAAAGLAFFCFAAVSQAETVNVYTERQPVFLEAIFSAFEQSTGIDVEVLYLDKGVLERLKSEGSHSPADVVIVADIGRLQKLAADDLAQPIVSAMVESSVPSRYRHPEGLWVALTKRFRVLFVGKSAQSRPATYEELADRGWAGGLCLRSGAHPYNIALFASHLVHHGEQETGAWLEGIKANLARKPQGNDRAQIKGVAAGECKVAVANLYYYYKMLNSDKEEDRAAAGQVAWIAPTMAGKGVHANVSGAALARHGKNQQEALELIEYMVGEEAQRIYASENYELPVREGVAMPAELSEAALLADDGLSLEEIASHRKQASTLVEQARLDR